MDTYEQFVKNIGVDIQYILNWFDSTIVLYKLVGQFHSFNIRAGTEEGRAIFVINSADVSDIDNLLNSLRSSCITVFSRTYSIDAGYDIETSTITLRIKEVPMLSR